MEDENRGSLLRNEVDRQSMEEIKRGATEKGSGVGEEEVKSVLG